MADSRRFGRAWALASVGGFVDAVGFLTLFGLFTAHQSGNTTHGAVGLGLGEWSVALSRFVPVLTFVAGVVFGVLVIERRHRSGNAADAARPVLLLELTILAGLLVAGEALVDLDDLRFGTWGYYGLAVLAASAMGLQAAALRRIGQLRVSTAFITGMLVSVAEDAVGGWRSKRDGRTDEAADSARRVRLHGGVWLAYVTGGVLGAVLERRWGFWALVLPIAAVTVLVAGHHRQDSNLEDSPSE